MANDNGGSDPREQPGARPQKERNGKGLSALDRAIQTAVGMGKRVGREDDPAATRYPNLWDWLTRTGDGGDYLLQPASVSIQLGPEGVLATVTHRDLCISCGVAADHLDQAFAAIESELAKANPAIRSWGKTEPNLRKRRMK